MNQTKLNTSELTPREQHFLWHLRALGIANPIDMSGSPWKKVQGNPVRVAIIDNGVDPYHFNLSGAIPAATDIVDFSSSRFGTLYDDPEKSENVAEKRLFEDLQTKLQGLGINIPDLSERIEELETSVCSIVKTANPARFFGAHGTACAGLVGGRTDPDEILKEGQLPYYGINPFCRIIPIATPYSHDIWPVIHALLYAIVQEAEVILMPRGLPHPDDRLQVPGHQVERLGSRITQRLRDVPDDPSNYRVLDKDRKIFEALINALAPHKYIVFAAGNEGRTDALAYPASLRGTKCSSSLNERTDTIGNADHLCVATAVNRVGERSTYANRVEEPRGALFECLSDDAFAFDSEILALNPFTQKSDEFSFLAEQQPGSRDADPWGILSLDVTGQYGYSAGTADDPPEGGEYFHYDASYSIFGGTSAAACILAGAISLWLQIQDRRPATTLSNADLSTKLEEAGILITGQSV